LNLKKDSRLHIEVDDETAKRWLQFQENYHQMQFESKSMYDKITQPLIDKYNRRRDMEKAK
jgi:hypothetical protein